MRLHREHPADRLVEHGFRHLAAAHEVGQMLAVEAALHAHVDAGEEGEPRRVAPVRGEAVGDHFLVAGVVGDDEALETPLAAQQTSVSSQRLPVAGMPEISLNDAIADSAPASNAALNGGR